jgi:hypothetical protein
MMLRVSYITSPLCTNICCIYSTEPGDLPEGDGVFALCSIVEPSHTPTLKPCNAFGEGGYDIYRASTALRKCKLAF